MAAKKNSGGELGGWRHALCKGWSYVDSVAATPVRLTIVERRGPAPTMEIAHVVSPYLHAIAKRDVLPAFAKKLAAEAPTAARMSEDEIELAVDLVTDTLYAMSGAQRLLLEGLRSDPGRVATLAATSPATHRHWLQIGLLLPVGEAFRGHAYRTVELEINRHCNFRCSFCPVARVPKPRAIMEMALFERLLDRVVEYGAPNISLNHYSEPTLTGDLVGRIRLAAQRRLRVRLHTNASLFNEEKLRAIAELGNTRLIVNLPSLDRREYERVTGSKLFDRVIGNLELIHQYGIRTTLSVNRPRDMSDRELERINDRFASMFGESIRWPTDSRAGHLTNDAYAKAQRHEGRLAGCERIISHINVSYEGKVFLCCQDFNQEYVLGDLRRQSLKEIAESERAVELRRWIFGLEPPPSSLICVGCNYTRAAREATDMAVGVVELFAMGPKRHLIEAYAAGRMVWLKPADSKLRERSGPWPKSV